MTDTDDTEEFIENVTFDELRIGQRESYCLALMLAYRYRERRP